MGLSWLCLWRYQGGNMSRHVYISMPYPGFHAFRRFFLFRDFARMLGCNSRDQAAHYITHHSISHV